MTYTPSATSNSKEVVDEIALLLTSGRMNMETRDILRHIYDSVAQKDEALRLIQQLAISAPEFHSTGLVQNKDITRPTPAPFQTTCKTYKAVINIMLGGGMDSFNLLAPYGGCKNKGESG